MAQVLRRETGELEVRIQALTPDGDATVLHLVHRDLPAGQGPRHMEGWEHFVPRLVEAATGRDPGPDPWSMSGAM